MNDPGNTAAGSTEPARDCNQGEPTPSTSGNVGSLASKATAKVPNTGTPSKKVKLSTDSNIINDELPGTSGIICNGNQSDSNPKSNGPPQATQNVNTSKVAEFLDEKTSTEAENSVHNDLQNAVTSEVSSISSNSIVVEPEPHKRKKVDIFVEDSGPKWYDVQGINVTQAIDPNKLTEAFESLPIFGRPNTNKELPEFQRNKIREFVGCGLSDAEFSKLEEYCNPEHLLTGKEKFTVNQVPNQGVMPDELDFAPFCYPNPSTSKAGNELSVVKKFRLRLEKDITNSYAKKLKYRGLRMMPLIGTEDDMLHKTSSGQLLDPGQDILFRVRIYRPYPYNIKEKPNRVRHSVFCRDVLLLGRQKLSELRDRILCTNDMDMRLDVSDRVDDPPTNTARELFPSGYMFINNVFYVDTRVGCADLPERVWQWARNKKLGEFPRKDMCLTRIDQLRVRLGHPEVYVHQGNCEHLFTFSEIRLLGPRDPLRLSQYPRHTATSQNQTVYCTTCAEFGAKWIVTGCDLVPFDPAFFCETCLKLYLYLDPKSPTTSTKVSDFKAYSYRGNEICMLKPQG